MGFQVASVQGILVPSPISVPLRLFAPALPIPLNGFPYKFVEHLEGGTHHLPEREGVLGDANGADDLRAILCHELSGLCGDPDFVAAATALLLGSALGGEVEVSFFDPVADDDDFAFHGFRHYGVDGAKAPAFRRGDEAPPKFP